jgi:Tfp pilus assembly protein PilF
MRLALAVLLVLSLPSPIRSEADPLSGDDMKHFAPDATQLGWKYFQKGDYETALRRFQMAIRHDADFAPAYFGAAYVCSAEGKLDEAIKYYRETLKKDTLYVYTYANLGYALLQKGKFPEALQMLDKALEIDPKCGEAHLSYANYYAYKQDWKNAEQSVNKAMKYGQKIHPELREMLEKHGVKIAEN